MPMIDLTVPSGSLTDHAKAELMATLTRTLLKWEGTKPGNEAAESIAWTFLHEPALVTVAGRPAQGDHQRDRRRQLGRRRPRLQAARHPRLRGSGRKGNRTAHGPASPTGRISDVI